METQKHWDMLPFMDKGGQQVEKLLQLLREYAPITDQLVSRYLSLSLSLSLPSPLFILPPLSISLHTHTHTHTTTQGRCTVHTMCAVSMATTSPTMLKILSRRKYDKTQPIHVHVAILSESLVTLSHILTL